MRAFASPSNDRKITTAPLLFYDGRYIIHQGFRKLVSMMLRRHRWAYASLLWEKDLPNPLWARRVSMTA